MILTIILTVHFGGLIAVLANRLRIDGVRKWGRS